MGPLTAEVLDRLTAYAWPGNVRELQNVIERAVILSPNGRFELGDFGAAPAAGSPKSEGRSTSRTKKLEILRRV